MQHDRRNKFGRSFTSDYPLSPLALYAYFRKLSSQCAGIQVAAVVNPLAFRLRIFAITTGPGVPPGWSAGPAVRQHVHVTGVAAVAHAVVGARD